MEFIKNDFELLKMNENILFLLFKLIILNLLIVELFQFMEILKVLELLVFGMIKDDESL